MNKAHKNIVPVQYVVFDLGRVLIDWEPERLYKKLILDTEVRAHFLANICNMDWHTAHDAGLSFTQNADQLIKKYPEYAALIHAWGTRWFEMFNGYIDGVPSLIDALIEAGYPLYALSNMPAEPWAEMKIHFPYLDKFQDVIVSGQEKCVKPSPEIYRITLARMGNPAPETVLFIDDNAANITAAAALGFQTHLFKSAYDLNSALKILDLLA